MNVIRSHNTLRVRFALWTAGLLFAALGLFGALVYFNMARGLASSVDDSLEVSTAQAIAAVVDNGQLADGLPVSPALTALNERGLTIRILAFDGTVIEAVGLYRALPMASANVALAQQGYSSFASLIDPTTQERIRFHTSAVMAENRVVAIMQVGQSLDSVDDALEQLLTILIVSIPLLVGLTAAGGYFLAARALSPIDVITQTAQRISAHDLHQRLKLQSKNDEVGRLATTFDMMLGRLEASFQRERQFTADASHELRTPLTAMQTVISVLRERRRTPEEYERALDDFAGQTNRLRTLVEDLLHLARIDASGNKIAKPVDLSALLQDVSGALFSLAEAKRLRLSSQIAPDLMMLGDADDLIRLFINLLDNAIKFTEIGEICVQAITQDERILITITDTGIGIEHEHLRRLFDRFYRADVSRSVEGSGLGLSIAQAVAAAHQGTLTVESHPGRGTHFTVTFPKMNS
ncbi:MAG: ATP-binding protein [Chloroflexota bacterium]